MKRIHLAPPRPIDERMPRYRLTLAHGLSAEKFEALLRRLNYRDGTILPVVGGGRSLVVELIVACSSPDAVRWLADERLPAPYEKGVEPRVRVEAVEAL